MLPHFLLMVWLWINLSVCGQELNRNKFPDGFMFGAASSAYQIEGGWNENGKGENIWDRYTHETPNNILDGSNADIACDSYHKLSEDVTLLKQLGLDFYHFSLSWSRILPKGFAYRINPDGIHYYNKLINLLIANGIVPMVTIFHSDTPRSIEEMGGFSSALIIDWFEEYARIVFESFGDRVKYWITFSGAEEMCLTGYGGDSKAPGYNSSGVGDYLCAHNVLKAHAKVYHLYNNSFKAAQKGRVSISIDGKWFEPATQSFEDIEAAERLLEFSLGWFADPIYHVNGDYPKVMKDLVAGRSKAEGYPYSRLPDFTKQEIEYIKGTYDYFGLSHYTTLLAYDMDEASIGETSHSNDYSARYGYDSSWPKSSSPWLKVVPWGFRKTLNWIKKRYGNPEIIVTRNGYPDRGEIIDQDRINYLKAYLSALLDAIYEDKVKITGYAIWSFLDSFEWEYGYTNKFGIYHVNFSDPNRTRTPKSTAGFYKEIISTRRLSSNSGKKLSFQSALLLLVALFYISSTL